MRSEPSIEEWSGHDVSVAEIERMLAALRVETAIEHEHPHQRTSVLTHVAWVPPAWLDAAEEVLLGMAERHPSRTLLLVPMPDRPDGLDADVSVRCFPSGDHAVCGEVIELHLRGARASAPASLVLPLAISDLPVFLRWRGLPEFDGPQWRQLVGVTDRVVVDSDEWATLDYHELADDFEHVAVSDLAWARTAPMRIALAGRWPEIKDQAIAVAGPRAEAALLRGWLISRLGVEIGPPTEAELLSVSLDGESVAPRSGAPQTASDLLSAELDRLGREPVYEAAVAVAAAAGR